MRGTVPTVCRNIPGFQSLVAIYNIPNKYTGCFFFIIIFTSEFKFHLYLGARVFFIIRINTKKVNIPWAPLYLQKISDSFMMENDFKINI